MLSLTTSLFGCFVGGERTTRTQSKKDWNAKAKAFKME